MTSDDLRERGIQFLLSNQEEDKQPFEFAARELMTFLRMNESSVYAHMSKLVKQGIWGTRRAFDPEIHKTLKVWWLIE